MDRKLLGSVSVILCALLFAFLGCAQKAAVVETPPPVQEQKVEPQAPPEPQKDTTAEDEARRKAMEEQAMKEAEARLAALFDDIRFDFDKSVIKPEFRDRLREMADWLTANDWQQLTIEGNCDEKGTAEYNLALGQRRAEAAKGYLVNLGSDAKKIKTISYGKERPLDPGHDEEAWAKNRRDHFVLTK